MLKPAEVLRSSLHGFTEGTEALALTAFGGVDPAFEGESFFNGHCKERKANFNLEMDEIR